MKGPLKTHGGKHYLARRIVNLMPPHTHYVEPYAGGLAVLLAKPPEGISEVINDLDGNVANFWQVLQDKALFTSFQRRVQVIPFSEPGWREAQAYLNEASVCFGRKQQLERAVRFFVCCRQSMSGRGQEFSPLSRSRTRRGMNEQAAAWLGAVDGLAEVHDRLRRVVILNRPALEVLWTQDGLDTLFYLDPPYLPETRTARATFGPFEMTAEQHEELLVIIRGLQGRVMISGYPSSLYDARLAGWSRMEFDLPNHASSEKSKRRMTEVVWCNFRLPRQEAG